MLDYNKVYNMDAIEGLKMIPDETVDCVLVDPPYNIGKDFGNSRYKSDVGDYVQWCKLWIDESARILKPSGTMYIYGFSEILAHISVSLPLEHRWLVWHYTNKTVPSLNMWQRSHESILCAWKDKSQRIFNRDDVREPYTENFIKGYSDGKKKRPKTKGRYDSGKETTYTVHEKGALPRDVLKHSSLAGGAGRKERIFYCRKCAQAYDPKYLKEHKECKYIVDGQEQENILKHPTQKPLELTIRLLKACLSENSNIVVPFVGSGSEVKVAKELNHNFIGFELNPEYMKLVEHFIDSEIYKCP
jgi:site-specific DNA-methyltransferase (adenine-specific)